MSRAEPFEQSRLQLAGFDTRALRSAIGRAIADIKLVFFHGWSDSADTFKPLLRDFALAGIGGIALDLPGCGHADDLQPVRSCRSSLSSSMRRSSNVERARLNAPYGFCPTYAIAALRAHQRKPLHPCSDIP